MDSAFLTRTFFLVRKVIVPEEKVSISVYECFRFHTKEKVRYISLSPSDP